MTEFLGFPSAAQRFLRDLGRNNNKAWFDAHRSDYEAELRAPMKALVEALDARLASFAPEIVGDAKRSMFRINRDIRFSKDKSPYKTNAGIWFYHQDAGRGVGQDAEGGAGFYFHLDAKTSFVAAGVWMPPRTALGKIRDAIAAKPAALRAIVSTPAFRRRYGTFHADAMLTRVPRGYPPDHPAGDWLRLQSFTVGRDVAASELRTAGLVTKLATDFKAMLPLVRWLNSAMGFRPATKRLL
ncbi:MAG: DUF2461 domain-containing protein [Gemmatimonadetes bacterium]|nr:DUF2461 domain-containing protein [Gemmatimonadota bacterium]